MTDGLIQMVTLFGWQSHNLVHGKAVEGPGHNRWPFARVLQGGGMGCTQLHIAQPVLEPLGADVQSFGQIQNFTRVTPRSTLVIGDGALAKVAQASQFGLRKAAVQAGVAETIREVFHTTDCSWNALHDGFQEKPRM